MNAKLNNSANKQNAIEKFSILNFLKKFKKKPLELQDNAILVPNFKEVDKLLQAIYLEEDHLKRLYSIHIELCKKAEQNNQNVTFSFNQVQKQLERIDELNSELIKQNKIVEKFNTIFENAEV
jgi:hypothetical protein